MELYHANRQWASRPADQQFNTLEAMQAAADAHRKAAREKDVLWSDLRVEATNDGDLHITGKGGLPAKLTHFVFGQLAKNAHFGPENVGAPAGFLRNLPATLAAQVLNCGLKARGMVGDTAKLLFHVNGVGPVLRAATTEAYSRLWNSEVIYRVREAAVQYDLVPARQTFNSGESALAPESEHPAALYVSDKDMFAFTMSKDRVIVDPLGQPLLRGVIVSNSEVGDASLKMMTFLFRDLCCNHIIWGASRVSEIRMPHRGAIRDRFIDAQVEIRKYLDQSGALDEAKLKLAYTTRIAGTKDEVLDKLFGIRSLGVSRRALAASYDAVVPEQDGDPNTVYGMVQGMTRHSQTIGFADERQTLDEAAGKLLDIAF